MRRRFVRLDTRSHGRNAGANTALIDGVRRFAMDVRELDIDLIDRINPFGEAYAILAKTMSEASLKQVAAAIAAKRTSLTPEEAKDLAVRAYKFKKERGRLPSISSTDAWEKRMAEGAAACVRFSGGCTKMRRAGGLPIRLLAHCSLVSAQRTIRQQERSMSCGASQTIEWSRQIVT
jgi:hypothetical protein